jgi:small GTP-binding protein
MSIEYGPGGADLVQRSEHLAGRIAEVADILSSRGHVGSANLARTTADRLIEQRFNVVVVGAFKRGKTTLVNAMLGAEYLPAAVVPLTSVVTCVTTGQDFSAEIVFLDGRRERIDITALERYVTEPGNPHNDLGVQRAIVTMPRGTLADGVSLIDTPGIGSIYRHNTDVARAFLAEADGAALVTSADPPISEAELEFLHEVRDQTARLFVVMNKADYLSSSDADAAHAFTKSAVGEAIGWDIDVYPMSARNALDARIQGDDVGFRSSGAAAFEHDLFRFLATDRASAMLASAGRRASRIIDEELVAVTVEDRSLDLSADERARTLGEMERIFVEANLERDDLDALLSQAATRIMAEIDGDLVELRRTMTAVLHERVGAALAERRRLRSAATEVEEEVRTTLRNELDAWRDREDRRVDELLHEATRRFGEAADRLVAHTLQLLGRSLGVALDVPRAGADLPDGTRFSYDFFRVPTLVESLVPDVRGYLPERLARRKLAQDLHATIWPLVDKHCGRLRYDYSQRVDKAGASLKRILQDRLRDTEGLLREAIERASLQLAHDEEHERRQTQLADARETLVTIRDDIRRCTHEGAAP